MIEHNVSTTIHGDPVLRIEFIGLDDVARAANLFAKQGEIGQRIVAALRDSEAGMDALHQLRRFGGPDYTQEES